MTRGRVIMVLVAAVVAVVALALLSTLGVPFDFGLSWALVVVIAVLLARQSFVEEETSWPPEERARQPRGSDVSRLAWSINVRSGVVGHVLIRRMERIIRRRLSIRGLDLDDPADHARIDALLGPDARRIFERREVQRSEIERVLDTLDTLPSPVEEKNR
ncbi:hypothetical protein [Streptomyces sp. AC495_CC817]|uniref:hypothetical protein n=1 Tax=Streptomyces sp. AC495_CC817 TaxID=2823900 RepID=UPI001C264009|nr:hypothetical protein [Streptomyces sp. AC495_CC817]